jgi:hypothetical protein
MASKSGTRAAPSVWALKSLAKSLFAPATILYIA